LLLLVSLLGLLIIEHASRNLHTHMSDAKRYTCTLKHTHVHINLYTHTHGINYPIRAIHNKLNHTTLIKIMKEINTVTQLLAVHVACACACNNKSLTLRQRQTNIKKQKQYKMNRQQSNNSKQHTPTPNYASPSASAPALSKMASHSTFPLCTAI